MSALAEYAQRLERQEPDPVLGPPSLSVGRIEGGQSVNIVPDGCAIEIDRRIIPGEDPMQVPGLVRGFLMERMGEAPAAELEFLPPWVNMPALSPASSAGWIEVIRPAVAGAIGREPGVGGVPYGTDAGPLARAGIPSVVLGPGDIARAHTRDEWIELDQLRAAVDVYYRVACAVGRAV